MDEPDQKPEVLGIEIPDVFHCFLEEGPFRICTICSKPLLHDASLYFIEKAYRRGEVIFEIAMCMECHAKLQQELSRESLMFIEQYLGQQVDLASRRERLMRDDATFPDWISHCLVTGKPIGELQAYQLCTICEGSRLLLADMPYMISGEVVEDIQAHLSKKTRERFDRFTEEHLGLGPEVKDLNLLLI